MQACRVHGLIIDMGSTECLHAIMHAGYLNDAMIGDNVRSLARPCFLSDTESCTMCSHGHFVMHQAAIGKLLGRPITMGAYADLVSFAFFRYKKTSNKLRSTGEYGVGTLSQIAVFSCGS